MSKQRSASKLIVLAGLDNAGKTSLARRHLTGEFVSLKPTLGMNVDMLTRDDTKISLIDLGGQTAFRQRNWKAYISVAHALIFVVDLSDPRKIPDTRYWLWQVGTWLGDDKPLLVIGAKADIKTKSIEEMLEDLRVDRLMDLLNSPVAIMETSAKTGEGVTDAFEWIYKEVAPSSQDDQQQDINALWFGYYTLPEMLLKEELSQSSQNGEEGMMSDQIRLLQEFAADTLKHNSQAEWDFAYFQFKDKYVGLLIDSKQNGGAAVIGKESADKIQVRVALQEIIDNHGLRLLTER